MTKQKRKNSIKRIIILLVILVFAILYRDSIGEEFESFLSNHYFEQEGIQIENTK
ncbi:MAG: hypothetical protein PHR61_00925 [Candidatus Absconditabacteria bacterium]|nr:hypothetical protein [Candidatus Absconditabacteria bacterium]